MERGESSVQGRGVQLFFFGGVIDFACMEENQRGFRASAALVEVAHHGL